MKHLLVPTDLSSASKEFFDYAFNFAATIDADITIVHAYHPQPAALDGMLLVNSDLQCLQEQTFHEFADEVIDEFKDHEVSVKKKFLVGFAADTILKYADDSRAYKILMQTSGDRTLKKIFGSVSTEVMQYSEVPILLVPPGCKFNMIKKVVYADDFTNNHDMGLIYLDHLISDFLTDVICAHVVDNNQPPEHNTWLDLTTLNEKFVGVNISQISVSSPSIMEGLLNILDDYNADMIIMPSQKKGFVYNLFRHSVTRDIAIKSIKPILVIH